MRSRIGHWVGGCWKVGLALVAAIGVDSSRAADVRVVARIGDVRDVPSTVSGQPPIAARINAFERFSLNNRGQVAISAGTSRGTAVWSEVAGDVAIAVERGPAPGLPPGSLYGYQSFIGNSPFSYPFSGPPLFRLDDDGRLLYGGLADWPTSTSIRNAASFWIQDGEDISLIAGESTAAPLDYAGMYFKQLGSTTYSSPSYNAAVTASPSGGDYFAVSAELGYIGSTYPSVQSLWLMGPAGPRLLQTLPNSYYPYSEPKAAVNRQGEAAFVKFGPFSETSVVREHGELTATIADRMTVVPGAPATARFHHFSQLQLSDAGTLAFVGAMSPAPYTADQGVFVADSTGALRAVALEGAAAPGFPEPPPGTPGATFLGINSQDAFNVRGIDQQGSVLFDAMVRALAVSPSPVQSLWIDRAGTLTRLLAFGDVMPGLEADQKMLGYGTVKMNSQGLIVVAGSIGPAAGGAPTGTGVWALLPGSDEFTPVAITGQPLELVGGGEATLTGVTLGEVNERGEILLKGQYDGIDSLLVSRAVAMLSDFDGDLDVDGDDLAIWNADFGGAGAADADGDGHVSGSDFLRWQREHGAGTPSAASHAVPEPSTAGVALGLFAGIGVRGVRRR